MDVPNYLAQANNSSVLGASTGEVLGDDINCPLTSLVPDPFKPAAGLADDVVKATGDIIEAATGSKLDVEIYKAHLKQRYLGE